MPAPPSDGKRTNTHTNARLKTHPVTASAHPPAPTPPHQVGFFDDQVGPLTLAGITLVTLLAITAMAFIDVFA